MPADTFVNHDHLFVTYIMEGTGTVAINYQSKDENWLAEGLTTDILSDYGVKAVATSHPSDRGNFDGFACLFLKKGNENVSSPIFKLMRLI